MKVFRPFLLVTLVVIAGPLKSARAAEVGADQDAMAGMKLSPDEVQQLEDSLKHHPDDLHIRTKLLGHYFDQWQYSEWVHGLRVQEVLWIIQNRPEAPIAGLPYAQFDALSDAAAYHQGAALWKQQTAARTNDTLVLRNAANFFLLHDQPLAEDLLKQCAALEPENPEWPEALGHLYLLGSRRKTAEEARLAAASALSQYERAFALTPAAYKSYLLDDLTRSAFDAGDTNKARLYAEQVLQEAQSEKKDWNTGNAIHYGNIILGRLALQAGDIEQAKYFLIEAGKTPGSPQLDSFGPNMALAKELLEKGQKEVVLEYFDLCAKFWRYQPRLKAWAATIKKGGIPDFGANLDY